MPHAQEQNAPLQSVAPHRPFVTQLAKGPKRAVFLGQQQSSQCPYVHCSTTAQLQIVAQAFVTQQLAETMSALVLV